MKWIFAAIFSSALIAGPAFSQSAENGESIFKKCTSCHKVGDDAKNGVGPVLTGIIGRAAGSYEGFKYSKSMGAAREAGLVWDADNLAEYIANPTAFLRVFLDDNKAKAKMTFRLKSENDRLDVVAYLATFDTAALMVPTNGFCVVNGSQDRHLFVTETREGERQVANLDPGQSLCADATQAADGIVTVFENADGFEGCSRIVPVGAVEEMLKFAVADRCGWGSHRS